MANNQGIIKRIDKELAEEIKKFAEKNNMTFRQASKEFAILKKIKFSKQNLVKEIKI